MKALGLACCAVLMMGLPASSADNYVLDGCLHTTNYCDWIDVKKGKPTISGAFILLSSKPQTGDIRTCPDGWGIEVTGYFNLSSPPQFGCQVTNGRAFFYTSVQCVDVVKSFHLRPCGPVNR